MGAKERIVEVLGNSINMLAVHEMNIPEYSQNNLATRCNELERAGHLTSRYRENKPFKEWGLKKGQLELIRTAGH